MESPYIFPSLTRISDLGAVPFEVEPIEKDLWRTGDYIVLEVTVAGTGQLGVELADGRLMKVWRGDRLIGALGVRHATLEATGSWREMTPEAPVHVLTGAGLVGKMTSKSVYMPSMITGRYLGHVLRGRKPVQMSQFRPDVGRRPYTKPSVLLTGTSMSAGKTTASCFLIRRLRRSGKRLVGAKLTGAGRYKDILAMRDAGAEWVFDFVDVGLPSTVCRPVEYIPALNALLSLIEGTPADIAILEIGASPLEPYNGDVAIREVRDHLVLSVLCASDPYAVLGVMDSFDLTPDFVTGIATNTRAGVELVEKLCRVKGLNLLSVSGQEALDVLLEAKKLG